MKKLLAFVAASVAAVSLATAEITVGGRGIFGWGLGTLLADDLEDMYQHHSDSYLDIGKSFDFGFAAFAKIPVWESLIIQPEIGFTHNTVGVEVDYWEKDLDYKVTYNALDLGVLLGWDLGIGDSLTVTPLAGVKGSFIIGDLDVDGETGSSDDTFMLDLVFGASAACKLGPGALVGDVRYNFGLIEIDDFMTPRALQFGLGYQIAF